MTTRAASATPIHIVLRESGIPTPFHSQWSVALNGPNAWRHPEIPRLKPGSVSARLLAPVCGGDREPELLVQDPDGSLDLRGPDDA